MTDQSKEPSKAKPAKSGVGELTPLLRQYQQIKAEHPDHVLFFRCGDFYEMFFEDARTCSEVMGITLTSRGTDIDGSPVPLAGVPYHSVDGYLARMIRAGYRVAMCEQTENPKTAKGVVRREVVRVVTPGTVLEESLLSDKANNYLVALIAADTTEDKRATALGLAALDFSTGEFLVCEFSAADCAAECITELVRLSPSEVVVTSDQRNWFEGGDVIAALSLDNSPGGANDLRGQTLPLATVDPSGATHYAARQALIQHFGTRDLHGFGLEESVLATRAAGVILQYLAETQRGQLIHVNEVRMHHPGDYMVLDGTTQRSLELVTNLTDASRRHTLFEVLDRTATPMGGRMLRTWILQPLRDSVRINQRLDAVDSLVINHEAREKIGALLKGIADMERIVSRCSCGSANGRDLLSLKNSLQRIGPMRDLIVAAATVPIVGVKGAGFVEMVDGSVSAFVVANGQPPETADSGDDDDSDQNIHDSPHIRNDYIKRVETRDISPQKQAVNEKNLLTVLSAKMNPLEALSARLNAAIADQPPLSIRDGGMLNAGYNAELDELRSLTGDSKSWIAALRQREAERTGINNLKVGFNRVFGYYLEVSHSHVAKVPPEWIRKQTLTSGERYVTPELKEKEEVILNADERANELEFKLFEELRAAVCAEARQIQATAQAVAQLDALYSFAVTACARRYVRPTVEDQGRDSSPSRPQPPSEIIIRDGRHPVLETLRSETPFVPNDTRLDNVAEQILIITGPNMAGKSTYIRQVALITLMAHIGSFVPATEARMAPVDRIFTRVGAMDQIAKGQSTFLVEMSETANILNNATDNSLVILDEIGRGTSTYDGLSIAWSVVEYLHNTPGRRPKTLFATHYHELAGLEGPLERVRNYNVAVHEEEERVAFLYRILRGHTDHSYGIYAAQVAGLPRTAVQRARRILADLEKGNAIHVQTGAAGSGGGKPESSLRVEERTVQLTFFDLQDHPVLEKIRALEINALTPFQALSVLAELKQDAKK